MLIGLSLLLLALGAAGIAAIFHFLVKRFKKTLDTITGSPHSCVGQLHTGLAKSRGKSVPLDKPIVSPLTQTECVFYHFKVEELRTGTSSKTTQRVSKSPQQLHSGWVTVINDRQAVPCGLQDDTGMAHVDLLDAEMVLTTGKPKESSFFDSCPPELQESLKRRYDFSTKGLLLSKSLRYTETLIRPGDQLFVVGDVEAKAGEPPTFLKRDHTLVVSDQDEAQVLRHFRRSIVGAYVGIGLVAAVSLFAAAVPIYIRSTIPTKQPVAAINKPNSAKPAATVGEHKAKKENNRR
jgi:hypothetical protein